MSQTARLDRLEQRAPAGVVGELPPLVIRWPGTELTPEELQEDRRVRALWKAAGATVAGADVEVVWNEPEG